MRVLVTGASGFVGSHIVKALLDGGREVRALVRSPRRLDEALGALGCAGRVETFEGDVTERSSVVVALDGCDAVVHGAAVYSLDPRRAEEIVATNVGGAENVLGAASELGVDPIIHLSTYVALLPSSAALAPETPVGVPAGAYAASKAEADRAARRLQAEGAPLTIIYPGFVLGPQDPWIGESTVLVRDAMAGRIPFPPPGSVPVADVRDVATAHLAALDARHDGSRYIAAAELLPLAEMLSSAASVAGRKLRGSPPPERLMLGIARVAEAGRRLGLPLPIGYQGPWIATHGVPVDASATVEELGVRFRPAAQTIEDTARWLIISGHVRPRR